MTPLLGNVGIPMICVQVPVMACAFIPVVLSEALFIRKALPLSWRDVLQGVVASNIASTIVGVPLAWGVMFLIELGLTLPAQHWHWTFTSPISQLFGSLAWLPPIEGHGRIWMIPAASGLLLVPSFIISVLIERPICVGSWANCDPRAVRRSVFHANIVSYALLLIGVCVWLAIDLQ
jgi:hypothetical protein